MPCPPRAVGVYMPEPRSQRPRLRTSGVKLAGESNASPTGDVLECPKVGLGESEPSSQGHM